MSRAWVGVAVMVMVTLFSGGCDTKDALPSMDGLLQAREIEKQLNLIDTLLMNLVDGYNCRTPKLAKEKNAAEGDEEETTHDGEETTGSTREEKEIEEEKEEEEKEKEERQEEETTGGTGEEKGEEEKEAEEVEKEEKEAEEKTGEEGEEKVEEEEEEEVKDEKEEEEKCDYAKKGKDHTMLLPPNEECNVIRTGITDVEKELILSLHNDLRSKVAEGNESQGDPGPQLPAADMHQLIWNDEMAKVAQAWAAQCPDGHDSEQYRRLCSRKYRTGQNINYYWSTADEGNQWQKAISNWYSEVKDIAAETAKSFMPHRTKKIGHYTQLIWGKTKEIGCGMVYYQTERHGINYTNSITHVCNYGPAGNILKRPFYDHGQAASTCPETQSNKYPALCI
ncbi:Venom allergen 5 [Chionoecetes opilio]|uniref:Venom allergen 5 n=1 Tax=Chionoecetes opilio TaxID=41210 RepID=A0A8J4Y889_CHIOP|nr:Venom allergen 5 [Chionoecetes opilio]